MLVYIDTEAKSYTSAYIKKNTIKRAWKFWRLLDQNIISIAVFRPVRYSFTLKPSNNSTALEYCSVTLLETGMIGGTYYLQIWKAVVLMMVQREERACGSDQCSSLYP